MLMAERPTSSRRRSMMDKSESLQRVKLGSKGSYLPCKKKDLSRTSPTRLYSIAENEHLRERVLFPRVVHIYMYMYMYI